MKFKMFFTLNIHCISMGPKSLILWTFSVADDVQGNLYANILPSINYTVVFHLNEDSVSVYTMLSLCFYYALSNVSLNVYVYVFTQLQLVYSPYFHCEKSPATCY